MAGFEAKGINQVLGLNEKGLSATVLCPIGLRAENDGAATRPKYRLSTEQLVVSI
jgi:hypothetical protein